MSVQERQAHQDVAIREVERRQRRRRFGLPAIGLLQAMKVTLRALLSRAVTVHYPEERMDLPERARGVIALLEENCTVCMLCAKECPCWCIYIEGHKETKPGKRKPVNALDRFAIDFGLCMYCGICVEVCPFDALHWSPYYEYTAFSYEGMVHELPVLTNWEHHVLPPPELVEDAEEKAQDDARERHDKRAEGVWAIIREDDKREAFIEKMGQTSAVVPGAPAPASVPGAPPQQPTSSDTPPAAAPPESVAQAPASPVPSPSDAPSPQTPGPSLTATTAAASDRPPPPGPHADPESVPRVDVMRLPDGIGPVERGRLKKLAVLQERGHPPPQELVDNLSSVLDQMRGG